MADADDNELTDAEAAGFGDQPEGETPTGYVANFEGDEIDGKRYKLGERIASDVDSGTIAYLVQNGRITPTTDGFTEPSGGDPITHGDGGEKTPNPDDANRFAAYDLNEDTRAAAQALFDENTVVELKAIAEDEKVELEGDDNKADIAAKIALKRAAE